MPCAICRLLAHPRARRLCSCPRNNHHNNHYKPSLRRWNIGEAKGGGMKDLGAGEWNSYVCLEAALIGKPMTLPPANSWTAGQTFVAAAEVPAIEKKKK